jgi:hypothetical protein
LAKPTVFQPTVELNPQRVFTEDEERELHEYMLELGGAVYKNRILVKPYFADKVFDT